jgi:hypothetical protein
MVRRYNGVSAALCAALLCLMAAPAGAELTGESEVCPAPEFKLDKYRYLRALSLDLRGKIPSTEEYAMLDGQDDVPAALIDQWLAAPEFAERAVRWHKSLLWNNLGAENLLSVNVRMTTTNGRYWRSGNVAIGLRGQNRGCADKPARFDDAGELVVETLADGTRSEGWVEVEPYWAPGTRVRVCAFDAQDRLETSEGQACGQQSTSRHPECGCGPNLRWCATGTQERQIRDAMAMQVDRLVREIVEADKPYTELFTATHQEVNGPLVHYWTHMTLLNSNIINYPEPISVQELPALGFDKQDEWVKIEGGPQHAGVLTLPAYLLRFQTNRARANQFFVQFMCQPFQPPSQGLEVDARAESEPDLQVRAGCKYCHGILEPAAAHWGRWRERGAAYLEPVAFPAKSDQCAVCAQTGRQCSAECRSHYSLLLTDPKTAQFAGMLKAYTYLAAEHAANVEQGPRLLALRAVADNKLPACVSRHSAEFLLGRPLTDAEQPWVEDLVRVFAWNKYSYRSLVRAVVTSQPYRSVR